MNNYLPLVKQAIIATYCNEYFGKTDPDKFVEDLNRIFVLKQKVLSNIAEYVKKEVEVRGKPLNQTLNNITFFSAILVEYLNKNGNQPIKKV